MKTLAVLALLLAGCSTAAAAPLPTGKWASDPYPKTETSSTVEERSTEAPVYQDSPAQINPPADPAPRDLLAECRAVIAELHPRYPQAPGWADPVCQEPDPTVRELFGRDPQGFVLWQPKTIHLQPTDERLDLRYLYRHEIGHSWCEHDHVGNNAYRYSEACADRWAAAA